ncbi:beta-xylosidase [Streptomyces sp. TX20-6-3]|uniref:beta-xylosidase n=1 Tax=Streptomyces sp. TX20-6-3 TaxID=3028705 RepID=UPI0029B1B9CD|nr:beta-xylosidase [Streptomyces sp. TX20-6-3]MDX2558779.1 beta-xylosidase [Streptomyces sp. TX20-6-3]
MALTRSRAAARRRRWTAVLGATALAVAGGALAAPAGATTTSQPVEFQTRCVPPPIAGIPPLTGTTTAEITVDKASPKVGETVTVTYTITKPAASNPVDLALPADIMTPSGKVVLGGAQSGAVTVNGPKKNAPVPPKGSFPAFSMTGTFTVTQAGSITLSPGDYNIHTSYLMELDTPCTVLNPPAPVSETVVASPVTSPNTRALALDTASGDPGVRVTVNGSKFTPLTEVTVVGRAGAAETADKMTVTTDSEGSFAARLKVNDVATTGIVAYEGAAWDPEKGAGPAAYKVVVPAPPNSQTITAAVTAGELSMTQAGDAVELSSVDFGQGGAATGALRTVTVKDFRGGPAGWSLTGKVTDFTGTGGSIGAGNLSWTPACTAKAGSPSACAAGSSGPVGGGGATLASTPNGALTGGEFTIDAGLSLDVPAFTAPGSYAGVLTLTLS